MEPLRLFHPYLVFEETEQTNRYPDSDLSPTRIMNTQLQSCTQVGWNKRSGSTKVLYTPKKTEPAYQCDSYCSSDPKTPTFGAAGEFIDGLRCIAGQPIFYKVGVIRTVQIDFPYCFVV